MQSLEGACEEGEQRTIKRLKTSRSSLPLPHPQEQADVETSNLTPSFCIFTKSLDLHREESARDRLTLTENKRGLTRTSHILEKVLARERLNTLILNLYPGNKGYSLAFPTCCWSNNNNPDDSSTTAKMIETQRWPYEEDGLLKDINKEELPPYLVDLFQTYYSFLFYNGCIVLEVRDYRQSYPHSKCDIYHVLLRPTQKSILADVNNICDGKPEWGSEERQQLESQILQANNPTLCLGPQNGVSRTLARITRKRHLWSGHKFRRAARKFSQVTVNKKRKLDLFTHRPGLELYEFLSRARTKQPTSAKSSARWNDGPPAVPAPSLDPPPIAPPSHDVVINEFKTYQRPKESSDCQPQLIEEYVLEPDMPAKEQGGKQRVYHIKLSILQRPSNSEYLGELYLDRDHKENEQNGVACRFSLGSRANANRYIHQFTEIVRESGRKSVRIRYRLSQGYKERVALAHAQAQAQSASVQAAGVVQQQLKSPPGQSMVNGTSVGSRISLVQQQQPQQQNQSIQNTSNVPILQSHLQGSPQIKPASSQGVSSEQLEINALASELKHSAQQFQAAAANAAIINLLNSSPASSVNSDASAAVVNAINNSTLLPQQVVQQQQQQTAGKPLNQKVLAAARKMSLSNVGGATRVLNHIAAAVNNNRVNLNDMSGFAAQQQQRSVAQTITLASPNYSNYTTVSVKQPILPTSNSIPDTTATKQTALSALLVGTPAADRPEIIGHNTNSLLLEKLGGDAAATSCNSVQIQGSSSAGGSPQFIQGLKSGLQYMVQSPPKVVSPLSSPPPHHQLHQHHQGGIGGGGNTINFTHLQSLPGLQNLQVQFLNVSSTGGHPTGLLVSMPVTTCTTTTTMAPGQAAGGMTTPPTVVLTNAGASNIGHLVTTGLKQGVRPSAGPSLTSPNAQPFQLLAPMQRPRNAQQSPNRTIQRTPITIKMATPNNSNAASLPSISTQLQKQAQYQQYQQLALGQQRQKNNVPGVAGKIRRRSNAEQQ